MIYRVRRALCIWSAAALCAAVLAACQGMPAPAVSPPEPPETTIAAQATSAAPDTSLPSPSPVPTPTLSPSPMLTEAPTQPPTPSPTPKPKATPKPYTMKYWIYVDKGTHTVTVFTRDSKGEYTKVVKKFQAATGSQPKQTPVGVWEIKKKERWHKFGGGTWAQYCSLYYSDGIFIHSPVYSQKNNNTLVASYYNKIGTNDTGGCLRMTTDSAKWIYDNCAIGTRVEIVNNKPKGPAATAKPPLPEGQTWDPTDPNPPPPPTATPAPTPEPSPAPSASPEGEG